MSGRASELSISGEVAEALEGGRAVLALESTIITHGMPWPRNLETARAAEAEVRDRGAAPATIAILDGRVKVGLEAAELERLARDGTGVAKCSRRDIPFLLRAGATAGTTVAATMIAAHMAGIRIFATGGIGGVHRGGAQSLDISADLQELARTPVAVVCAGPKSILDIGLTLEYLETHGVPVVGYGTSELPAFHTRESGYSVDYRLDTPADIAAVLQTQWSFGLEHGAVIGNPVPEEHALDRGTVDRWIETAILEAEDRGISGKELTPFLLQRIETLSEGQSLETNVQLMLNNARLGAEIAMALADGA